MNDLQLHLPDQLEAVDMAARMSATDTALLAETDAQRMTAWLVARGQRSANTFMSYRREAARLLAWLNEQGLLLADMKVEHTVQFYELLRNPPLHWLRPRKPKRDEELSPTQLLIEGLDDGSIGYSRRVLGQMFSYLIEAGHARFNVFKLSPELSVGQVPVVARILDVEGWVWLWRWILAMPRDTGRQQLHATRARWLFALLYHTGMRREEAAKGMMADFIRTDGKWTLRVIGKGTKVRFITVNSVLLEELVIYRGEMGVDTRYPTPKDSMPLVMSVNRGRAEARMTPRAIGMIVAEVCAAAALDCEDEHIQARIASMSTHWLRHTHATHRHLAGAATETNQQELGHADIKTTMIYQHILNPERERDAEKLAQFSVDNLTKDGEQ